MIEEKDKGEKQWKKGNIKRKDLYYTIDLLYLLNNWLIHTWSIRIMRWVKKYTHTRLYMRISN